MLVASLAVLAPPVAGTPLTSEVIDQYGRDDRVLIAGGCETDAAGGFSQGFPDRYMDAGEKLALQVKLLSQVNANVNVRLRAVEVDADSPAQCPCDSLPTGACPDPARMTGNPPIPSGLLTIVPSGFTPISLIAGTPLPVSFDIAVDAGVPGLRKIELLLETDRGNCVLASRQVLNADEGPSSFYSTDFPAGGLEVRDYDNSETAENPDAGGRFETIAWSDLTAGGVKNTALQSPWNFDGTDGGFRVGLGDATDPAANVEGIANWGEDKNFNGIEDGACVGDPSIACYHLGAGTDPRCAGLIPTTCSSVENNGPVAPFLVNNWSMIGGCGWQTKNSGQCTTDPGHSCSTTSDCNGTCRLPNNEISSTFAPCGVGVLPNGAVCDNTLVCSDNSSIHPRGKCTVATQVADCGSGTCVSVAQLCFDNDGSCNTGAAFAKGGVWHTGAMSTSANCNVACQRYEGFFSTTDDLLRWYELLTSPVVEKVNQTVDGEGDPVATAQILELAWNQTLNLRDELATFTWELDNDVADPAQVDLIGDLDVLGSLSGPLGAASGVGAPPTDVGNPLFAAIAKCVPSDIPCVVDGDCPSGDTCVYQNASVNGAVGGNRKGQNSCFFDLNIPPVNRPFVTLALPPDDDTDNDGFDGTDEYVAANGPIRNMSITKAGGPDLRDVLLEDLVGDTGNRLQAALGFLVKEGNSGTGLAGPSFGVAVDDVVLEWREFELVPDQASCGPGEAKILSPGNQGNGVINVNYQPACDSTDNTIVYGALANVGNLPAGYAGAVCSIGNTGTHLGFNPMAGSYFFFVVANDGAAIEGSYGEQSSGVERPFRPGNCGYVQSLTLRCD